MDPREGVGKDGGGGEGFPVVLSAGCAFVVLLFAYVARDGGKKKQTVKLTKRGFLVEETGGWVENIQTNTSSLLSSFSSLLPFFGEEEERGRGQQRRGGRRPMVSLEELEKQRDLELYGVITEDEILIFPPKKYAGPPKFHSRNDEINMKFRKRIQEEFPDRFLNDNELYCYSCKEHIRRIHPHYRCADLNSFVVCLKCMGETIPGENDENDEEEKKENSQQNDETKKDEKKVPFCDLPGVIAHKKLVEKLPPNEQHSTEFFYKQTQTRHQVNTQLIRCVNSRSRLLKIFDFYGDRIVCGEKNTSVLFSSAPFVRENWGKKAKKYHYFSNNDLFDIIVSIASTLLPPPSPFSPSDPEKEKSSSPLFMKEKELVGIFSANRFEWIALDLCCTMKNWVSVALPNHLPPREIAEVLWSRVSLSSLFVSSHLLPLLLASLKIFNQKLKEAKIERENRTNGESEGDKEKKGEGSEEEEGKEEREKQKIRFVVCFDNIPPEIQSEWNEQDDFPLLIDFETLIKDKKKEDEEIIFPPQLMEKSDSDKDIRVITFTSGSTGTPKGVRFTEKQWGNQLLQFFPFQNVVMYGYLPLDHVAGRSDVFSALCNGGRIIFPEPQWKLPAFFDDMQNIRPTAFGPIPFLCNAAYDRYESRVEELKREKKRALGEGKEEEKGKGKGKEKEEGGEEEVNQAKREMRNVFGNRLCSIKVTSAPCAPHVIEFLRDTLQICVNEGYGSTEVGSITLNQVVTQPVKLRSVPELGFSVKNDPPRGEIMVKRVRYSGYQQQQKSDMATKWVGGWFCTGDIGERIGDHAVKVVSRDSDVVKLSNGLFVSLSRLEQIYTSNSILIHHLLLYADSHKPGVVAIVVPSLSSSSLGEEKRLEREILKEMRKIAQKEGLVGYEVPLVVGVDINGCWSNNEERKGEKERGKGARTEHQGSLFTATNKMSRKNLVAKYKQQIDSLYVQSAMDITLAGLGGGEEFGEEREEENWFDRLGGSSIAAMQLVNSLREQNIQITYEEVMNQANSQTKSLIISPSSPSSSSSSSSSPSSPSSSSEDLFSLEKEFEKITRIVEQNSLGSKKEEKRQAVFLTGATGFVGKQILREILRKSDYTVFCLVRKLNAIKVPGINDEEAKKIVEVLGDLSKVHVGLKKEDLNRVCQESCQIIHCGAVVNHLLPLDDVWKTNVKSVVEIIEIAQNTPGYSIPIHFISSTSAKSPPSRNRGYGSSKWLSEKILRFYKEKHGGPVTICRLPLVCGNRETGEVNPRDWLHLLLQAMIDFNAFPITEGPDAIMLSEESMAMISADFAAMLIFELMESHLCAESWENCVLNFTPPNISMRTFMSFALAAVPNPSPTLLPYPEFIDFIETSAKSQTKNHKNGYSSLLALLPRFKGGGLGGDTSSPVAFPSFSSSASSPLERLLLSMKERGEGMGGEKMTLEDMKKHVRFLQKKI